MAYPLRTERLQPPNSSDSEPREDAPDRIPSIRPREFPTLMAECAFVCICTMGQLLFGIQLGNVIINQVTLVQALDMAESLTPWLIGSFLVANGVSVIISGSLADLISPKWMVISAFIWSTVWNLIGIFSVMPSRRVLFFIVRAMQGFSVGTLCSTAMSMLGRVYRPGVRKNRVFAIMGAVTPMGFVVGALQGGALSAHLGCVFGSTAFLSLFCALLATLCAPHLETDRVGIANFDLVGAITGMAGCGLIIFGLTQGAPTHWAPYTYALVIVGVLLLGLFAYIESRVQRPLIDNRLWLTPGFLPSMASYFLGFGGFCGGWQFYAIRFMLTLQKRSPIVTAAGMIPIGISGALAAWIVGQILHLVPGHLILVTSMIAFALGPVFSLPQDGNSNYWAFSFPGFVLSTFGPDMSFAAISIFITSSVPKTYQGAAGSLLITAQNLSTAVMAALGDTIGASVTKADSASMDLDALRAIWWFSLGVCLLGAAICILFVRIPKSEEKEHII